MHPNLDKLLEHYSSNGKIGLRHITLPGRQSCFIILLIICEYFDYLYPGPQPNLRGLQHLYIQRWEKPTLGDDDLKAREQSIFLHFQVDTEEAAEWADSVQWLLLQKHVQVDILCTPEGCLCSVLIFKSKISCTLVDASYWAQIFESGTSGLPSWMSMKL